MKTSRAALPIAALLLTGCPPSRGYVPPATPPPPVATWTVPIHVDPPEFAIPPGAVLGKHWRGATGAQGIAAIFEAAASGIPAYEYRWATSLDVEPASARAAAITQLREVRYDVVEDGASLRLLSRVTELAYDSVGPEEEHSRAHVKADFHLLDDASGATVWSGTHEIELRAHGLGRQVILSAFRSCLVRAMGDPDFRARVRKPVETRPE